MRGRRSPPTPPSATRTCAVVSLAGTLLRAGTQEAFQLPEGVSHVSRRGRRARQRPPRLAPRARRALPLDARSDLFADGEVCVQKTPSVFVDSLWETFGPFPRGVPLVVAPSSAVRDLQRLLAVMEEYEVSRIVLVPAALWLLLDAAEASAVAAARCGSSL